MRKILLSVALGLAALPAGAEQFEQIEHGRALTTQADCAACHTGDAGDFAGGVALSTPFGTLVGSNITPDMKTGIGSWTREEFRNAVKHGVAKDGHDLYPAMPYTDYVNMTDDDVDAIYDYLMSLKPVSHKVQENQLPFPFNQRIVLKGWKMVNATDPAYQPDPDKSAEWNRGRYLVMGAGHCGACHSPRNMTGGSKGGEDFLTGATLENWHAPDITPDPHDGLGSWSQEDIIAYLKTGTNSFDTASGPMAEEVALSSSHWSDADLKAVATYLKEGEDGQSYKASAPKPLAAGDGAMKAGAAIYADRCSACHSPDGTGIAGLYPKLAGAPLVNADDPTSVSRVILAGSEAGATTAAPTGPVMPSFGTTLSDAQVAAVATFVRNSWGNAAPQVSADKVKDLRDALRK